MFYLYYSWRYKTVKIVKSFAKVELFGCAVSLRLLKIEHFFLFAFNIPMIDLGIRNKVTAVLKLKINFFPMGGSTKYLLKVKQIYIF